MSVYRGTYTSGPGSDLRTGAWCVAITDHRGQRRVFGGCSSQAAAFGLQTQLRALVISRREGTAPAPPLRRWIERLHPRLRDRLVAFDLIAKSTCAALRPLDDLLDDWRAHLGARGATAEHVRRSIAQARRVIAGVGAKHWSNLEASAVERYLQEQRDGPERLSARTSNSLLQSVRGFARWAVRTGIATEDPLRSLEPLNVQEDRRLERRALTPEELRRLLEATAKGPVRGEMPGPERALLYQLAAETGLRANEIRTLNVGDLDVADPARAAVRVRAATAKNRREAHLPLRQELAEALGAHVARRLPSARVFGCPKRWRQAQDLRDDLAAAEVPAVDGAGREVDFHALRVTFGTNLARAGVALQLAQRLMRHSTPLLTANVYTVLGRDDDRAAIASLPDVAPTSPAAAQAATGTDGPPGSLCSSLSGSAVPSEHERDRPGLTARTPDRPGVQEDAAFRGCERRRAGVAERQTRGIQNPVSARV